MCIRDRRRASREGEEESREGDEAKREREIDKETFILTHFINKPEQYTSFFPATFTTFPEGQLLNSSLRTSELFLTCLLYTS